MSEWLKEHAWKLTPAARVDAHQNPPTHHRSISCRYNEVLRDAPVSDDVHPGFRGVCDTVLTQKLNALRTMRVAVRPYASLIASWPFGPVEAIWSIVAVRRWWCARAARSY